MQLMGWDTHFAPRTARDTMLAVGGVATATMAGKVMPSMEIRREHCRIFDAVCVMLPMTNLYRFTTELNEKDA